MASSQRVPPEKRAERNLECESLPGSPACPPGRVSTGVDLASPRDGAGVDLASAGVDLVSTGDGAGVDLASTRDATTFFPIGIGECPLLEGVPVNRSEERRVGKECRSV